MSIEHVNSEIMVESNIGVITRIKVADELNNGDQLDTLVTIEPFHMSLEGSERERFLLELQRLIKGNAG